ncbi:MAG TPA: copper chaperone PCu(A)C [Turneriella sp.]|nr:copper chaperone PCu(A)C [Turneriella sp.]HNA78118.1 copper chaperone PCu(A)C [Turneriella sp.]HNL11121.1 copper chaperone PCu(A)C [Turneriella sp.]
MTICRSLQQAWPRPATARILAVIILLLFAACGRGQHSENGLVFGGWYIVKPVVDRGMTTAYGKVTNVQPETTVLTTVSLDCADKVELHETVESAGRVSMLGLAHVTLPAGATISFQPGGKHLMVSGFKSPASGKCQATFTVAGRPISFAIPVRDRTD